MEQSGPNNTRTELSRPGEPGITLMMVEKGIERQRHDHYKTDPSEF